MLFLVHCGGSHNSASSRMIIFSLSDTNTNDSLSMSLSEEMLTSDDYAYTATFYTSENEAPGPLAAGPFDASEYNVEDGSYFINPELENGTYWLIFKLVKRVDHEVGEITLYQTEIHVEINDSIVTLDLTNNTFTDAFDMDEDDLTNIVELNIGTDPLDADSDGDNASDGEDSWPTDASEWTDTDGDGAGDNTDTCPATENVEQTDSDGDGTGDACDMDADNDGVDDEIDNCPEVFNPEQTDTDSDGTGDACDDDKDGDGLSATEEAGVGTNDLLSDSDGDSTTDRVDQFPTDSSESADNDDDGVGDNADNCPTLANDNQADLDSDAEGDVCDADDDDDGIADNVDNCPQTLASASLSDDFSDQTDTDADGFGVACDCDNTDASFNSQAEDAPDTFVWDTNCDGIDGNVNAAVFVSLGGSETATGTSPDEPAFDLQGAIETAYANGFDVYLTVGEYQLTDLQLADGVSLYGGFSTSFNARQSVISDGNKTTLYLNSSTADGEDWLALLNITDFTMPVTLAGLNLVSESQQPQQILLAADNAHVTLEHNHFTGSESADAEFLITLEGTDANISANYFSGRASETSVGISLEDSRGTLTNNIFNMGSAQHTTAVELSTSEFDVLNNTIDGGRHEHGTAFGLDFSNSVLTLINNIFITQNSNYQASFRCQGPAPESPVTLFNNLFLRYSSDGIVYPAYITCSNGRDLLTTEDELDDSAYASELNTSDNTVDNRTQAMDDATAGLSTMLDETFQLVTEDENPALNSGQDVSDFDVTHDFWRNLRSATPDLGAHESE